MAEKACPLLKAPCLEHGCRWFIQILGNDPQSGATINKFACAVEWLPVLMIENSQQQRQTGAAVESFRNEISKSTGPVAAALAGLAVAAAGIQNLPPKDVSSNGAALEHKES